MGRRGNWDRECAIAMLKIKSVKDNSLKSFDKTDNMWKYLAKEAGLQLPKYGTKLSTGAMTRWRRKLGMSIQEYLEYSGKQTFKQFINANPAWGLRAFAGILLEWRWMVANE